MTATAEQLIDIHAHFVTPDYVEAARAAGHLLPDGMRGYPTWSAAEHLDLMDSTGIRTSMLSISSPGTHFGDDRAAGELSRRVNEFAADVLREHPGRFGHFASLPLPDVDGALAEAVHALDVLGSNGVSVETNHDGAYLGDPRFDPLWRELDGRGAVVFVHPTSPPCHEAVSLGKPRPMLEFLFDSTRAVSDLLFNGVLRRYPRIQWVITHGGGALPLLADRMELFRTVFGVGSADGPTVQAELRGLWFDMAGSPFPHQVPVLTTTFGYDRLLYGSDYCWTPAAGAVAQIASIDAAEQPEGGTWHALTTRNAARLLPELAAGN
ncbi:amidohydrolase family protein [Streptomyces brasiliensis]|uniref:Amidohydrolase n=1 Tax=Streptomyces brasiliensis TaxID=1954 RepID=A0A917KTI6_9ACTN|nr:amidohydrolase family protein [Streptomyces brasiliensis]GGJ28856.1 amidohydrolase [Streptomyces brasiliensis]